MTTRETCQETSKHLLGIRQQMSFLYYAFPQNMRVIISATVLITFCISQLLLLSTVIISHYYIVSAQTHTHTHTHTYLPVLCVLSILSTLCPLHHLQKHVSFSLSGLKKILCQKRHQKPVIMLDCNVTVSASELS